jgi:hypothetical protein
MLEIIKQTLLETPWWVYLLFAYLVFIGFKAKKGGVVSFKKLIIMPIVLSYLSFETLVTIHAWHVGFLCLFLLTGLAGAFVSYSITRIKSIKVDRKQWLIDLPGSNFTLIIVLVIFFSKYYVGMRLGVNPAIADNVDFKYFVLALSGVTLGLLWGRLGYYYYYLLNKQKSTHLIDPDSKK